MTSKELSEYLKNHLLHGVREEFGKDSENIAEMLEVLEEQLYLPGDLGKLPRGSEEAIRFLKRVTGKLALSPAKAAVVREGLQSLKKSPRWYRDEAVPA